jgi:hypothetical protein
LILRLLKNETIFVAFILTSEVLFQSSKQNLDSILVQDPYSSIKADEIAIVDGTVEDGLPVGLCTVKLKNGDFLVGVFRDGQRQGRGGLEISTSVINSSFCVFNILN